MSRYNVDELLGDLPSYKIGNDGNTNLDIALSLAGEFGFPVFPCYPWREDDLKEQKSKKPACKNGLLDATTDLQGIRDLWRNGFEGDRTDYNIGIRCGKRPDGLYLTVLDTDPKNGGDSTWRELCDRYKIDLDTPAAWTGTFGIHYYTLSKEEIRNSASQIAKGIDVRGEGGYVLGPGSRHPNGNYYTWIRSPREQKYAFFPSVILKPKEAKNTVEDYLKRETNVRLDELTPGNRNEILFRFGCQLRNDGLEEDEILEYLQLRNSKLGNFALDDEEVIRIAKSAMRYKAGDRTMGTADDAEDEAADAGGAETRAGDTAVPPWYTAEELIEEAGEFEYVLEPFLAKKNVSLLEGYTGSGKTITAYEWCWSILTGEAFLGEYEPAKDLGPILYFDQDNPSNEVGERFKKIGLLGFQERFSYYHFKGYDLENKDKLRELGKIVEYYKPCLVVFDTLIKFHQRDENSSTEMAIIMKRIRQIANLGPAVLVLHQLNKTENARKGGRGSNEIQASADLEFVILEKREQGILTIESAKIRKERVDKIYMKIESSDTTLKMAKADQEDRELTTIENIIMRAGREGIAVKDIDDELKNDYNIKKSRATLLRNLRKLIGGSKIRLNGGEGDKNSKYVHRSFDFE